MTSPLSLAHDELSVSRALRALYPLSRAFIVSLCFLFAHLSIAISILALIVSISRINPLMNSFIID